MSNNNTQERNAHVGQSTDALLSMLMEDDDSVIIPHENQRQASMEDILGHHDADSSNVVVPTEATETTATTATTVPTTSTAAHYLASQFGNDSLSTIGTFGIMDSLTLAERRNQNLIGDSLTSVGFGITDSLTLAERRHQARRNSVGDSLTTTGTLSSMGSLNLGFVDSIKITKQKNEQQQHCETIQERKDTMTTVEDDDDSTDESDRTPSVNNDPTLNLRSSTLANNKRGSCQRLGGMGGLGGLGGSCRGGGLLRSSSVRNGISLRSLGKLLASNEDGDEKEETKFSPMPVMPVMPLKNRIRRFGRSCKRRGYSTPQA